MRWRKTDRPGPHFGHHCGVSRCYSRWPLEQSDRDSPGIVSDTDPFDRTNTPAASSARCLASGDLSRAGALLLLVLGINAAAWADTNATRDASVVRGEYLLRAGGCVSCHTADGDDAVPLAGGRALETPFGTFYTPNITPDEETGIGAWSDEEFLNAFWEGVGPSGRYYFPAFPFPAYTGISREDLLAIKAYLFSLPPVRSDNQPHELDWYVDTRLAAAAWQLVFFDAERFEPQPGRGSDWNRGAYLVRHLGHCGECHSPRNRFGATLAHQEMAGGTGPGGKEVPNITPHREGGIGRWTRADLELFLELGMMPDGDFAGGSMTAVIDDNTSQLTPEDRAAIATYLESLPPLPDYSP
jgi:mono/diheme cytochrome c family protein